MAIQLLHARLANIHILVTDSDMRMSRLVREVLYSAGFRHIHLANDGSEGLSILQNQPIDLVITDWQMRPMDGLEFLRRVRLEGNLANRTVPFIMLTARSDQQDVLAARDSGINEYVIKPFTPKSLFSRVVAVVENPRSFIIAPHFVGPSRRRRLTPVPGPEDRRGRDKKAECVIITKAQLLTLRESDGPVMLQPDFELKKKIGANLDMNELLRPEQLEQSERVIRDAHSEFVEWAKQDMAALEFAFRNMRDQPEQALMALPQIRNTAFLIKSRAGTFGYTRASEVAELLYKFTGADFTAQNAGHLTVVEKHLETLQAIFLGHVTGDGGPHGKELLDDLNKLVVKYK